MLDVDQKSLWHPYASVSNNASPVNYAKSGSGSSIVLDNGMELLDGVSSWWCMAHGHNHPFITEAIERQMKQLNHVMFAGFTHAPAMELAEELLKKLPPGLNKIFFADSGSIAVECAVKMALQYQFARGKNSKSRLVALRGGYHGDTVGTMALSDPAGMHESFRGILPGHFFAPRPNCRFGEKWDSSDFEPMNELLSHNADSIAAVIVEPIFQGANGMWFYHPQYLKELRYCCDKNDVLLIFDEIATGFGRTGKLFAAEHAGVNPDIMTLGKILSGGAITLGAAVATEKVENVIAKNNGVFLHGPTFMANPLACAAATASMRLLDMYDYLADVQMIESRLKNNLSKLRSLPQVNDVRTLGAIGVVEVNSIPDRQTVQEIVLKHQVWLRPFGKFLYAMPPFICTPAEIDRISEAIKALAEHSK